MATLTRAHEELFCRGPDEQFASLDSLMTHCRQQRSESQDRWHRREDVCITNDLDVVLGGDPDFRLNDWSFSQLCRMANVSKDTINRLTHETAAKALEETLPLLGKPLQFLTSESLIRSVHRVAYTRLWNDELLNAACEAAPGFQPPQTAMNEATGLCCGEQDMFCFLIDPQGWIEIGGQAFAPGFFVWNSEVGRRTVGIQTFWFQKVCRNHIVWDAVDVVEASRKHTARVRDFLDVTRQTVAQLVEKRDARRDGFARVLERAMREKLGEDAEAVMTQLQKHGIPKDLGKTAIEMARGSNFTIFSLVDALTQLTQKVKYAGDRVELDAKVATLLSLVA